MMFLSLGELAQTQSYLVELLLIWWTWWLLSLLAKHVIKERAGREHI